MNEQIKKLAEDAGYFFKFEKTGNGVTMVHTKEPGTDGDLEYFAELVVIECLKNMEGCDGDLDFAIWKTKKDFLELKEEK